MRLLFEKGFGANACFTGFYAYLRDKFDADVVLHFGMHGALEFPARQASRCRAICWPIALLVRCRMSISMRQQSF